MIRITALFLCLLCLAWGIWPSLTVNLHVGSLAMITVGALGALVCVFFPAVQRVTVSLWHTAAGKFALSTAVVLASLLILLFFVVSVLMATACAAKPADNVTVVVLGAGLKNGAPSRILKGRLDVAAAYLQEHPNTPCILSGGQGPDEPRSEAVVMKEYLVAKGIRENRLFCEEESHSTYENLEFSKRIIDEKGLPRSIALVTQEFHQFRAQQFAKKHGFSEVGALVAHTPAKYFPSYWLRDFAGICHMVVFGN